MIYAQFAALLSNPNYGLSPWAGQLNNKRCIVLLSVLKKSFSELHYRLEQHYAEFLFRFCVCLPVLRFSSSFCWCSNRKRGEKDFFGATLTNRWAPIILISPLAVPELSVPASPPVPSWVLGWTRSVDYLTPALHGCEICHERCCFSNQLVSFTPLLLPLLLRLTVQRPPLWAPPTDRLTHEERKETMHGAMLSFWWKE